MLLVECQIPDLHQDLLKFQGLVYNLQVTIILGLYDVLLM